MLLFGPIKPGVGHPVLGAGPPVYTVTVVALPAGPIKAGVGHPVLGAGPPVYTVMVDAFPTGPIALEGQLPEVGEPFPSP